MYLVTIDNGGQRTVIHEWWPSSIKIVNAQISREKSAIDSLTFDIYPNNPGWGKIKAFSTLVEVTKADTGAVEFYGRVLQPVPSMDSGGVTSYNVTCEGPMGFLADSMQEYKAEQHYGDTDTQSGLQVFIAQLLSAHNAKVEEYKRVYTGNITLQTFETSGGVTKAVDRASTWDNISEKLLGSFGGEMRVRRGSDGLLYLDYAEKLGTTRSTAIELGRNMIDAEMAPDPSAVITRFYPYGAKIKETVEDEDGNETEVETEERVDISSVNGGKKYIDDTVAIQHYGIVEGFQEFDDITQPANLLTRAREWLGENNAFPVSTKITAVDLSQLGLDYDDFSLYDIYPVRNELIGLDDELEIVRQTIDVNDPSASSFEFGETSMLLSASIDDGGSLKDQFEIFRDQVATNITNVNNIIRSTMASIKVMEDRITSTVSESVTQTVTTNVTEAIQPTVNAAQSAAQSAANSASQAQQQAAQASQNAAEAAGIASGKADVLIQSTAPGADYEKATTLWIDTTDGANTPKRWNGETWEAVTDKTATDAAQAAADAKNHADEEVSKVNTALGDLSENINNNLADMAESMGITEQQLADMQALITVNTENITQLLQTSSGWDFQWQEITETITELAGTVSTTYEERLKYIRFIDGEIWLGRDPDPGEDDFKVVISNERIRFLQNNIEVAYISNQKLYITNAEITDRLDIGNFYFSPRSNGNMTLRYNG